MNFYFYFLCIILKCVVSYKLAIYGREFYSFFLLIYYANLKIIFIFSTLNSLILFLFSFWFYSFLYKYKASTNKRVIYCWRYIKLILKIAYTTGDRGMLNQIYIYYSETNEPNRIKHGFAESEIFQYFDVFSVRYSRKVLEFHCMVHEIISFY